MRLYYRVALPPDEAVALLRTQVDRPSPLYLVLPRLTTGAPFVGTVTGSGFDIRVRRRYRNSLAPHAVGVIRAAGTDSEIRATVGVGAAIRHALAVFIGLIGVLAAPAELSSGARASLVFPSPRYAWLSRWWCGVGAATIWDSRRARPRNCVTFSR
jgi:hypothetical protein